MPKNWLQGVDSAYDVVVVGSGLGGLTAALQLARSGARVLVLEHHYQFGGLATWFKRPGRHSFDISLHGFPAGMRKSVRKYWSPELAQRIVQLDQLRFKNPTYDLTTRFDQADYQRLMQAVFGCTREQVDGFFAALPERAAHAEPELSTGAWLAQHLGDHPALHRFLLEPISYANGSTLEDPAQTFAIVFYNFMRGGVHIFSGGTESILKALLGLLRAAGVELRRNALVEQIEVSGPPGQRRVEGVLARSLNTGGEQHRQRIRARAVLSNANLKTTLMELVGREVFDDAAFLDEARAVRVNHSSCQVYFGCAAGTQLPPLGDLVFTSKARAFSTQELVSPTTSSRTFSLYPPQLRGEAEAQRPAIVASLNARYDDWAALDEGAYAARKAELIRSSTAALAELWPEAEAHLEHVEAATPKTFRHYTRHWGGTSFGTKFEGLAVSRALPKQVEGLYHVGSVGIIMSGWLGVINYAVMVAHEVELQLREHAATP